MKLFRSPSTKSVSADSSAPQAKSPRRRNFRFLRSVDQKRRESVSTQKRTRAHAKELAMAYTRAPASDTPNSTTSSNVNLLSRVDVATPSPKKQAASNDNFFDPFGNGALQNDPFANASIEEDLFAINKPPKASLDQHFATGPVDLPSKESTATTIDSFDHSSVGSDLDLFANNNSKPHKLDEFMGRQQQRGRNVVSMPSAGSGGVNAIARRRMRNQMQKRQISDAASVASSVDDSVLSSPPDSPRDSVVANNRNRKPHNLQSRGKSTRSSGASVAGSIMTSTTLASQSSFISTSSGPAGVNPNLWDSQRDGGFTFDAFGLDESQVQQDVDDAVQELVTEGHRGFSFFETDSDQESEFASQAGALDFRSSSRRMSAASETDGFEADFRNHPQHGSRARSPPPSMRGQTPPRWEKKRQGKNAKGAGFADFDNPWGKQDSWGSSKERPPTAGSEVSSSVFGGTKSEFMQSSSSSAFQGSFRGSPFSATKSDHGGGGDGYLAKLQYSDRGDSDPEDIHEDLAKEFAQEFVKRISPRHNVASPTSERSFGDFSEQSEYESEYSDYDDQSDRTPTQVSTPQSKFRNFRDRYESSKAEQPTTPAQSYRARAAQIDQTTPESTRRSSGSLRSSYAAATSSAQTPEEKKEDEDVRLSQVGTSKRGTLKAKWQKTRPAHSFSTGRRSPVDDGRMENDDDRSVQALPSDTPRHQRSSNQGFGRKSDINKSAFSRLREESTPNSAPTTPSFKNVTLRRTVSKSKLSQFMDNESVMQNSATSSPPVRPVSYRHQQTVGESSEHSRPTTPVAEVKEDELPVQRKLTYRERRDLELKKEAEEKAKAQEVQKKDPPKKDVAAMIRRRIAANKQKAAQQAKQSQNEVTDFRARLKPVKSRPSSPEPNTETAPGKDTSSSAIEVAASSTADRSLPPSSQVSGATPLNQFIQQNKSQNKGSLLDHETVVSLQAENADLVARLKALEQKLASHGSSPGPAGALAIDANAAEDPHKMLGGMLAKRLSPTAKMQYSESSGPVDTKKVLGNMLAARGVPSGDSDTPQDPKKMLGNLLAARGAPPPSSSDTPQDPKKMLGNMLMAQGAQSGGNAGGREDPKKMLGGMLAARAGLPPPPGSSSEAAPSGRPALKDDPKFEKYFKMMKVGMPKEVVKHAMQRDGLDPDILDADPNKPAGLPLKEDPKYEKYFKMLKIGIPMGQVKHSLERDGLNPDVMDQDHNMPASAAEKKMKKKAPKKKDTHRRARLHWKTMKKVVRNSIWGKIESDEAISCIDIDEDEFQNLFQAELGKTAETPKNEKSVKKKGPAVRVIDSKRANNGGIILARMKLSHDEMAEAIDKMDSTSFTPGQIESIIEYLPTKVEHESLEKYMIENGQDAAETFNGLCECEKFMVSMMTVKHAKRKISALLFKLQFDNCLDSIALDADMVEKACEELKQSNRLRQLLGIVLQFGNRLNTAGSGEQNKAGAFTLDSLLKLNEAKAFDKKTTFLHYIVLIVQRNNELLLKFDDDIQGVIKAEKVYWDQCISDLEDVENQLENVRKITLHQAKKKSGYRTPKKKNDDDESITEDKGMSLEEEVGALRSSQMGLFTLSAIKEVSGLRDKVDNTVSKFEKLLEYFGESESKKQPHELFAIFIKFSRDFKKAQEDIVRKQKKKLREERKKERMMEKKNSNTSKTENGDAQQRSPIRSTADDKTSKSSSASTDVKSSAKASFRDQARHRRLRQMQNTGRNHIGTPPKPVVSNGDPIKKPATAAPSNRPPPLVPAPSPNKGYPTAGTPSATPTGSRNLMRNRRRLLEERNRRSTPTDTSSPWCSPQAAS